ncbi:hypothetical protein EVG20_g4851 [Dentipellis fragilis]|uniref:Uncharacterized protein n=1 Tax=Dentipellis fragilis TaxID=205917 RepID=A0A4Y9YYP6_9AGAM|nr:hypothetical protein EVG20_g4851 [Dentipellis fragilis]
MLTRTLAAALTLLVTQSLPTSAGPIGHLSRGFSTSYIRDSDAGLIARFGRDGRPAGVSEKRAGQNLAVAAAAPVPQAAKPAVVPPAAGRPPAGPVPPRPSSSPPLSVSKALQPSASAAVVPVGGLSASHLPPSAVTAVATGTTFPTALPSGVSISVPSDFPGLGPESGTGLPLVTTLFSTPAVAFSTIAGSGADPGPSASVIAQAPVVGKSAAVPAGQVTGATVTAETTSAPGGQLAVPSASATVGVARRGNMRRISRESVLDGLD